MGPGSRTGRQRLMPEMQHARKHHGDSGVVGGPLQAASRTLLIRLAPPDRVAQCFGLFALTGKVTSFVGPLLIGAITAITASQKAGMAVLVAVFVAGVGGAGTGGGGGGGAPPSPPPLRA